MKQPLYLKTIDCIFKDFIEKMLIKPSAVNSELRYLSLTEFFQGNLKIFLIIFVKIQKSYAGF